MLEVNGIDVAYGHIQALRRVSLRAQAGEIVALTGPNGAGKSTVLRTISGLLRPLAGEVILDGTRIDRMAPERIVEMGVSHLPEGRGIFPTLSVEENLRMGYFIKRRDRLGFKSNVERVTELFPRIRERWSQAAGTLSGGEQQMLALARALLPEPRLLMIDELSLGLAPIVVQQLLSRVQEINEQGTTILLVEQYVNLALRIARRGYVMEKGRIAMSGEANQLLKDSEQMRASYLGGGGLGASDDVAAAALAEDAAATAPAKRRAPRKTATRRTKTG
ncbi:MAG: ABC transporter ATP-binding protein [Actinomycetota bacterium]